MLETVEIGSKYPAKYSVIWLHGLGADGHDFVDLVPSLDLLETRFIFPHAKIRPISINNSMSMRAWYDISSLDFEGRDSDLAGVLDSVKAVEQLLRKRSGEVLKKKILVLWVFHKAGLLHCVLASGIKT